MNTKAKTQPVSAKPGAAKTGANNPIPVRFDNEETVMIDELAKRTRLPRAQIVKRAIRFAAPKFLDGSASMVEQPA